MSQSPLKLKISKIQSQLDKKAPLATAEKWDNVGLLVGDPSWETTGAVVSVDLTLESIQKAKELGFNLIVNHHPCIFPSSKGITKLVRGKESQLESLILEAAQNKIAVISSHTNFDQCALEVVDKISKGLGVEPKGRLIDSQALMKLVVFVPEDHVEKVRAAICEAGAGHIGNYDFCTFSSQGEGSFRGLSGSQPVVGKSGNLEKVNEIRLETVIPVGLKQDVLQAMRMAHPYEEVAYDLYEVLQKPKMRGLAKGVGYGFWGEFSSAKSFSEVSSCVKSLFKLDGYWITEPVPKKVNKIAFVAGKGASFVRAALSNGCDLFVTGEAGYHVALEGARKGIAVMELGHRESERFYLQVMSDWLSNLGLKVCEMNLKTQRIRSFNLGETQ